MIQGDSMNNISQLIKEKRIYFDGGMGTMLQKRGLKPGESPELWNILHPDIIEDIHRQYLDAGANIITTNSFGINSLKYDNYEELIKAAISCAKKSIIGYENSFVAFDIGPLGKFLEPIGDLPFEDAIEEFAKNVRVADKCGVDLIIIETMTDSYETKAAVLAAKENSNLPIFVTNVYDETEKTLTGSNPEAMIAMLEGLGVSALGINCSLGPDKMVSLVEKYNRYSSLPIIANPNAGLPNVVNEKTIYSMGAEEFSDYAVLLAKAGANILGGCCGTEPDYIRETIKKTKTIPLNKTESKDFTVVSSYTHAVFIGDNPILIGERINPTGKPKLKQALYNDDINYLVKIGLEQADKGVHILDVNVGLPDIDECKFMCETVVSLQSVCDTPLQLDSNNPKVLEKSMRIYNGKALINSVNGDDESINSIFPLVKKYGASVIALTLDNNGIPETAEGRVAIALRIIEKAKEYGIDKKDIIFDPLAMAISSDKNSAQTTLKAVEMLSSMGFKTSLGISNISFGLPNRAIINSTFLSIALSKGLKCAIVNPLSKEMMDVYYSYCALNNYDDSFKNFINYSTNSMISNTTNSLINYSLSELIQKGLISQIAVKTKELLNVTSPLDLINQDIIPALALVGQEFENGKIFLPQLLNSAEASSQAFSIIKEKMPQGITNGNSVILATVKGDIHDIGKNIVKLMLESYGFIVYDLGKNVPPEKVLDAVKKYNCKVVALSALMTTTLDAMKDTINLIKNFDNSINIMVGGAVLNKEYADNIGADAYASDAMGAVRVVQNFYQQ